MSGYRNNLLSYCLDGVGAVYGLGLGLVFTLFLGSFFGVMIVYQTAHAPTMFSPLLWFGGVLVGLTQLWGIISYTLIAFEMIALFRVESHRWLILLTILGVQTCETTRMLLDYQDMSPWLQAIPFLGVLVFPILGMLAYRYLVCEPVADSAPYTDCRSCGYNLTGSLQADRTECPECGEPVTQYQHIQSLIDKRKPGGPPRR